MWCCISAGSAVSNTSEFDDPQPRKKRRLSADVNPDVINVSWLTVPSRVVGSTGKKYCNTDCNTFS